MSTVEAQCVCFLSICKIILFIILFVYSYIYGLWETDQITAKRIIFSYGGCGFSAQQVTVFFCLFGIWYVDHHRLDVVTGCSVFSLIIWEDGAVSYGNWDMYIVLNKQLHSRRYTLELRSKQGLVSATTTVCERF